MTAELLDGADDNNNQQFWDIVSDTTKKEFWRLVNPIALEHQLGATALYCTVQYLNRLASNDY